MSTAEWTESSRRWLAFPAIVALVVVGVWVMGGLIADSFRVSMALVTVWFLGTAAAVFLLARARRPLAAPLIAGYLIAACGVGGFLLLGMRSKAVDEVVVVGRPASAATGKATAVAAPIQEQT